MAVLYQRLMDYRRNKRLFFTSVITPALLLILGVTLSKIDRIDASESRLQTPDRLTVPQPLLINAEPIVPGGDLTG